ncbi:hypothetical protein HK098_005710, partial [Nowakowskiella sp. JEL0407]
MTEAINLTAQLLHEFAKDEKSARGLDPLDLVDTLINTESFLLMRDIQICFSNVLLELIKSRVKTWETIQYIHANSGIKKLLTQIYNSIDTNSVKIGAALLNLLTKILQESMGSSVRLEDDFRECYGYQMILRWFEFCSECDESDGESAIFQMIQELIFVGEKVNIAEIESNTSPYQLSDFRFPLCSGPVICNLSLLDIISTFCAADSVVSETTINKKGLKQTNLKIQLLDLMLKEFRANRVNFFVADSSHFLLLITESFDDLFEDVQLKVLEIIEFALVDLSYVTFKELMVLSVCLQGTFSSKSTLVVVNFFLRIISDSPKLKDVFREVGILSGFNSLIQELALYLDPRRSPIHLQKTFSQSLTSIISTCDLTQSEVSRSKTSVKFQLSPSLLENFTVMMKLLSQLLDHTANCSLFRRSNRGTIFELLCANELRLGVLMVVSQMITDSVRMNTGELLEFARLIELLQSAPRAELELKLELMKTIKWALTTYSSARSAFRENGGMVAMMSILISMEGIYVLGEVPQVEKVFEVLDSEIVVSSRITEKNVSDLANGFLVAWFELLIAAIKDHEPSRRFLSEQIGYIALEDSIRLTGILSKPEGILVFGGFFALAFEDPGILEVFSSLLGETNDRGKCFIVLTKVEENRIANYVCQSTSILQNTKVVMTVLRLLTYVNETSIEIPRFILEIILGVAVANKHNQVKLNGVGFLRLAFDWLFGNEKCWFIRQLNGKDSTQPHESVLKCEELLKMILKRIIENGTPYSELRYLFSNGKSKTDFNQVTALQPFAAEMILHSLRFGRYPSYIHFDHNMNDICCLLMDNFGRLFPPANGYSLLFWVRVQKFDTNFEIPLLGIMDEEDHVRLLVILENGTSRRIRIQTFKSTVVLDKFTLNEDQWYHIVIVHQKPRLSSSGLDLYINGKLIQHLKLGYLGHPGSVNRVRSFCGLPPDMKRPEKSAAIWNLGSAYMLEEVLLDSEDVNSIFQVGVEYTANFQGSLDKYVTRETTIVKSSPNDVFDKRENSTGLINPLAVLISQIKLTHNLVFPEEKLLFAITADNYIERFIRTRTHEMNVISANAANLIGIKGFFNSANPHISPDPTLLPSVVQVRGDLVVINPQRMNDGIWKLGGCAILLKLIEKSETKESLYDSFCIFVESVRLNWRNLDEMERGRYYEIVSYIIKCKRDLLSTDVIDVVGELVGHKLSRSHESIISNLSAYKQIYLDMELWRLPADLQDAYIRHSTNFLINSSMKSYNLACVNKMAGLKRWLFALKTRVFSDEHLPKVVKIVHTLVENLFVPDTIKTLCMYIVTTLDSENYVVQPYAKNRSKALSTPTESDKLPYNVRIRNLLLEMLLEILLRDPLNVVPKFVSVVSSRWILLFLQADVNEMTAIIACKIFACLHTYHESAYSAKFREGYLVMAHLLAHHYHVQDIYPSLLAVICGSDIRTLPATVTLDMRTLLEVFKPSEVKAGRFSKDIFRVILKMIAAAMETLSNTAYTFNLQTSENQPNDGISYTVQILLRFFSELYTSTDDVKASICTMEAVDDIISILFSTLANSKRIYMQKESEFVNERINEEYADSVSHSFETLSKTAENLGPTGLPVRCILDFLVEMCIDSVVGTWKGFYALELTMQAIPPAAKEKQTQFQSYLLLQVTNALQGSLELNTKYLTDPRVIGNVAKLSSFLVDRIFQGLFPGGRKVVHDFITFVIESINEIEGDGTKSVFRANICLPFYRALNRMILHQLGQLSADTDSKSLAQTRQFLGKCIYNQKILLNPNNIDSDFYRGFCFHLFNYLNSEDAEIKTNAMMLWKLLLLQKPSQMSSILRQNNPMQKGTEQRDYMDGFSKLLELDQAGFSSWIATRKEELKILFEENTQKIWENVQAAELKMIRESLKGNDVKRITKLKRSLKLQQIEEEILHKYRLKSLKWIDEVKTTEHERLRRYLQDYNAAQTYAMTNWIKISSELVRERALWHVKAADLKWKLDFIESSCRMRKKLRRAGEDKGVYISKAEKVAIITNQKYETKSNANSFVQSTSFNNLALETKSEILNLQETANNEEDSKLDIDEEAIDAVSGAETNKEDDFTLITDLKSMSLEPVSDIKEESQPTGEIDWEEIAEEDQNKKILRLLDHGDTIIEIINCFSVIGLGICEGIMILGRKNFYIIDDYYRTKKGELVDVDDIPEEEKDIHSNSLQNFGNNLLKDSNAAEKERYYCRKFSYVDIDVQKRLFGLRSVAFEIFSTDGYTAFIAFWDQKTRDTVLSKLVMKYSPTNLHFENISGMLLVDNQAEIMKLQSKWVQREISNFEYLMQLNTLAGRTYNDLNQYPVFPWVISDYVNEKLDLSNPSIYRDLSKPMGAQGERRRENFAERYQSWEDPELPPCHYGTHYSSAMIVCTWLIRLQPFTKHYITLQGGHFDHPDRLFDSIGKSWLSASAQSSTDVRELTPEFYYLPEFLHNHNKFDFGVKQNGETIDTVQLPPWAFDDARYFIQIQREALESEFVSANLHNWIDLIFGYKQQGEEAINSFNVFHYLSYEGAITIDSINDPIEKQAIIGIINNFGQTPKQIFKKPHPCRQSIPEQTETFTYNIQTHSELLTQTTIPLKTLPTQPVVDIKNIADKVFALGPSKTFSSQCGKYAEWDLLDGSLRFYNTETNKLIGVFENLHVGHITCAKFFDEETFVTGASDTVICIWKFSTKSKRPDLLLNSCLRGHEGKVLTLDVSSTYNVILSGGEDSCAILWDYSRMTHLRTLDGHEGPVNVVKINNNTGDIATCSGNVLRLWSINGDLISTKSTSSTSDVIQSCTFYEGKHNEVFHSKLIFTGHKKGVIKIWMNQFDTSTRKWCLTMLKTIEQKTSPASITCLQFSESQQFLLSGDTNGRVYGWMLPDGSGTDIHMAHGDSCSDCNVKFTVLERRVNCKACG